MKIVGSIIASDNRGDYSADGRHWIIFDSVENLVVEGGGTINGNGNIWWQNSCKINKAKVKILLRIFFHFTKYFYCMNWKFILILIFL